MSQIRPNNAVKRTQIPLRGPCAAEFERYTAQGNIMASPTKEQQDAAQQFVGLAIEAFKGERGVHAETAIAGVARMAGTFLFRSFAFPLASAQLGQAVLSEAANEQGPKLIQALGNGPHRCRARQVKARSKQRP
jgi:hypothetical protein